jgi:hypothetical protein
MAAETVMLIARLENLNQEDAVLSADLGYITVTAWEWWPHLRQFSPMRDSG